MDLDRSTEHWSETSKIRWFRFSGFIGVPADVAPDDLNEAIRKAIHDNMPCFLEHTALFDRQQGETIA